MKTLRLIIDVIESSEFAVSAILTVLLVTACSYAFTDFLSALNPSALVIAYCLVCLFVCYIITPSIIWLFKQLLQSGEIK